VPVRFSYTNESDSFMPAEPIDVSVQVTIVLELLGRTGGYSRSDLYTVLKDVTADRVTAALASLADAGVIRLEDRTIHPTAATQHLDLLRLIAI
jgi:hypothetical protein